jgi:hypothetical protein
VYAAKNDLKNLLSTSVDMRYSLFRRGELNRRVVRMRDAQSVSKVIEDYALETVPESQRKSGWQLMWMTAGLVTTLVQLLIGSYVTALAGVAYGVLAGVLV